MMMLRRPHALEMEPWIRGWGADYEMLAPEELRREIAEEVQATVESHRRELGISGYSVSVTCYDKMSSANSKGGR